VPAGGSDVHAALAQVPAPGGGEADAPADDEREDRAILLRRAIEMVAREVEPKTFQAAWGRLVEGRPAAEIAAELGMKTGAVHTARTRVLDRARKILAQFGEDVAHKATDAPPRG
jgi:DNA-directed RNA polymerase specialized sigma24 family protein